MKQITLNIKENKIPFFIELLKNFDFIEIMDFGEPSKEEVVQGIKKGLEEVQLIEEGKVEPVTLNDFLDEL